LNKIREIIADEPLLLRYNLGLVMNALLPLTLDRVSCFLTRPYRKINPIIYQEADVRRGFLILSSHIAQAEQLVGEMGCICRG
jgi:hypothetical protein